MTRQPPETTNPYTPPKSAADASRPPFRAAFTVGDYEQHLVEVFTSSWSSVEVYTVDGEEVLRVRNRSPRAEHRFEVGKTEKHTVTIKFDLLRSWRSLFSVDDWVAEAYVDDKLVVADLLPEFRESARRKSRVGGLILLVLLGLLIPLLVLLALLGGLLLVLKSLG